MERIPTGSRQIDEILRGGFPSDSINIIMGLPGTGKTILAEKLIFTNAGEARRAIYLSTLSEPLDKMLRYLQGFEYFDPGMIGDAIVYADLSQVLRTGGFSAFVDEVVSLLKEHEPAFLVIDSFKPLHAFAGSLREFRQSLSVLMTALSSLSVTSFLVGEYSAGEVSELPEFAVADGVVELVLQKVGVKDIRYLRVRKLRGSSFFEGEHAFRIGSSGLEVFPRLVTPPATVDYELSRQRVRTGVSVFDEMVDEGFWSGSSTVAFGPPGSGKTLLGLHFIFKGIESGQKGMIATMEENPTQLARVVSSFGWDLEAARRSGMLELFYVSPVDIYIDEFVSRVGRIARERGVQRLMVDSLNDLGAASPSEERFRDFMYSFVQTMSMAGTSLYMTSELREMFGTNVVSTFGISHMSDNVVFIHYLRDQSLIRRAISVVKTRASRHDERIREFHISSEGITVGDPFDGVDLASPR